MPLCSMAYDSSTGKVVVFGREHGSKYDGDLTNDIWIFDPLEEDWNQITEPASDQQ